MKTPSKKMIMCAMTSLFAVALLVTTTPKARADDFCRTDVTSSMMRGCGFATKEQCDAMGSGRGGYCISNPFPGKAAAHKPTLVYSQPEFTACQSMKMDCVIGGASSAFAYLPKKGAAHKAKIARKTARHVPHQIKHQRAVCFEGVKLRARCIARRLHHVQSSSRA